MSAATAKALASRQNGSLSKGPTSEAGKAISSQNALSHGFTASQETLFARDSVAKTEFESLRQRLLEECRPIGEAQSLLFRQYAFCSYQAERANQLETAATDALIDNPSDADALRTLAAAERFGASYARRAARAFQLLGQLQQDALVAQAVKEDAAIHKCQ
jgi:hypothetical protein